MDLAVVDARGAEIMLNDACVEGGVPVGFEIGVVLGVGQGWDGLEGGLMG